MFKKKKELESNMTTILFGSIKNLFGSFIVKGDWSFHISVQVVTTQFQLLSQLFAQHISCYMEVPPSCVFF